VVVDQSTRLHQRVGGRRPDEAKAAPPQLLGQGVRLGGRGRKIRLGTRRGTSLGAKGPDQLRQRLAGLLQPQRRAGILDRSLDLGSIADNPLVGQQPFQVCLVEGRDPLELEGAERGAERLALAKDGQP
jgi:hypothetical protein